MKTVLAPIDFSAVTDRVLKTAAELARSLNGRLVVLHVIQPPLAISANDPILFENTARITAAAERAADKNMARLEKALQAELPNMETRRLTGAPVAQIIDQARKLSTDYIVIGSHGHSALYELLVGSTTNAILRKAPAPVLIVPAADKVA